MPRKSKLFVYPPDSCPPHEISSRKNKIPVEKFTNKEKVPKQNIKRKTWINQELSIQKDNNIDKKAMQRNKAQRELIDLTSPEKPNKTKQHDPLKGKVMQIIICLNT